MAKNRQFVWVIGGGVLQLPIIKEAKSRGYDILITDRDPFCAAHDLLDISVTADTYDVERHLEIAEMMADAEIVACLTDAADVGPTVSALVHGHFNWPERACSYDAALKARDKGAVRTLVTGDSQYPAWLLLDANEAVAYDVVLRWWRFKTAHHGVPSFPCVVKPLDNCASRGISIVSNEAKLPAAIQMALNSNKDHKGVLIEQYIDGFQYATDWWVSNYAPTLVNSCYRTFHFDMPSLEAGHINPYLFSGNDMAAVSDIARHAVETLGVERGPFKMDLIYSPQYGWVLLECATRWSGGFDHTHTAVYATGRNLEKPLLDFALGQPVDYSDFEYDRDKSKFSAAYAPLFPPAKIYGWSIPEEARRLTEHIAIMSETEIKESKTCADRPIFVIASADSFYGAYDKAMSAATLIGPRYVQERANDYS